MKTQATLAQITLAQMLNFARLHDWGRNATIDSNALHLHDDEYEGVIAFYDFDSLRDWAGY